MKGCLGFKVYNFELDRVVREVRSRRARRVILQFPDGLKVYALKLAGEIESKCGVDVIVLADPCYGGCDVAFDEARRLSADLIIHFGHTQFLKSSEVPVVYIPAFSELSVAGAVKSAVKLLKSYRVIGLVSTVQHVHKLDEARRLLEASGFEVLIGGRCGRVPFDGQILGCDVCAALSVMSGVDAFLVIAGGDFHALGVALSTGKPVVVADPYRGEARDISKLLKRILSLRWSSIARARDADVFGVIVGVKPGQAVIDVALEAKKLILSYGRKCYLIAAREISPEALYPFDEVDAFVAAACPRIAIDDADRFRKPLITVGELKLALGGFEGVSGLPIPTIMGGLDGEDKEA
mgnify:CR=1 FL=1